MLAVPVFNDSIAISRYIVLSITMDYLTLTLYIERLQYDSENFSKIGIKMIQKLARRIDYNYVYRMNIITIDVSK